MRPASPSESACTIPATWRGRTTASGTATTRRTNSRTCASATGRASAYASVGAVDMEQGRLTAALKAYQASLAIAERLAESDPGNAGWQGDLSSSYSKVGDVQMAQGDRAAALKSYQASLAIRER